MWKADLIFSRNNNYTFSPHLLFCNNFLHIVTADIKTDATAEALLQSHHKISEDCSKVIFFHERAIY